MTAAPQSIQPMTEDAPHVPAAFINAISEEGTKAEAVVYLQKQWNECCALRAHIRMQDKLGASYRAKVDELTADLADYKQAASVEAGLRREFYARVGVLEYPFRNVDDLDWKHLLSFIPESGHGKFWKAVFAEIRAALAVHSQDGGSGHEAG